MKRTTVFKGDSALITKSKKDFGSGWKRAEFANAHGVNPETLRFYEKKGLLPKPQRTRSGYRLYQREHWVRMIFIRNAREVGFSLTDIGCLIQLQMLPRSSSSKVKKMAVEQIRGLKAEIAQLRKKLKVLNEINRHCNGKMAIKNCPILRALGIGSKLICSEPKLK